MANIDTLGYVKALEKVGIERAVAEAHMRAISDHVVPELASKQDIDRLGLTTKQDMDRLANTTKQAIDRLELTTKQDIDRLGLTTKQNIDKLDAKIDAQTQRIESMIWKAAFAVVGGTLAAGGLLLRLVK